MDNKHNAGFVMVSVLWILAILTVISLGFSRRAVMERRVAAYTLDQNQAMQMARGAAERAIAELKNRAYIRSFTPGENYVAYTQPWAKTIDLIHDEPVYIQADPDAFADDGCFYTITDNAGRISINDASKELLDEVDGLGIGVIREIMSYRTGDSKTPPNRYVSIEQLREHRSISEDDWVGDDDGAGLRDVLTVWSSGKINLNTASEAVLLCVPDIRSNLAADIAEFTHGPDGTLGTDDDRGAFKDMEDVSKKLGIDATKLTALTRYCGTTSYSFTIDAYATRRGGKIVAHCQAIFMGGQVRQWRENTLGT